MGPLFFFLTPQLLVHIIDIRYSELQLHWIFFMAIEVFKAYCLLDLLDSFILTDVTYLIRDYFISMLFT